MHLIFTISHHTKFYLEEAGYKRWGSPQWRDTYILVEPKTKRFEYSHHHIEFTLHPGYIPKVLTDTSLLDQIPLLVALGLSEKEIIEILRS